MTDYFEIAKSDLRQFAASKDEKDDFYDGWLSAALLSYLKTRRFTFMIGVKNSKVGSKSRSKFIGQIALIDELIGVINEYTRQA